MHPSFQSTTYTHAFQTQIHGPSNLKVFAGEDLSTSISTQPAATANASNNCSPRCGGNNNRMTVKVTKERRRLRRKPSISRLSRSTSTANSSKKRRVKDSETWKSHINRPTLNNWKKKSTNRPCKDNWRHTRNLVTSNTSQDMTSIQKTQ